MTIVMITIVKMTIIMITMDLMEIIMMTLKFCFYVLNLKLKISSSGCFHLHGTNCLNAHLSLWHMHYGVSIIVIIIASWLDFIVMEEMCDWNCPSVDYHCAEHFEAN